MASRVIAVVPPATILAALALLTAVGCGLSSPDAREEVAIPPTSKGPDVDLGLGPGVRPLSFGPGDKGSPRVSPSGDRVAFVLDGYVVEKPLYTQDSSSRTAATDGFDVLSLEWLSDEGMAVLGTEGKKGDRGAKTTSTPSSLFITQRDDSSSDGSSNVRELPESVEAAGAAPGSQVVVTVVSTSTTAEESSEETPRSRLMLLWGSKDLTKIYLGVIEGYVTGLSVSPDGKGAVLAVRNGDESQRNGRFEVQVYRFSEGRARRVASVPEGMEVLGAPQWTREGEIYFVAGEVDDDSATRGGDPAPYVLYRVPEDSGPEGLETPEPVRSVGEGFVAASISVSPDGSHLAVVGRRNPGSPTNLYILDLASDALEAATTNENMEIKTNPRDLAWSPDGRSVVLVARSALSGPEVYDGPAETLSAAFYNLYEVPVGDLVSVGGSEEG